MRCVAGHQDSTFDGAAPGDADIAGGQVAQPAVHEFGTPPAGAEGQIMFLDEHDAQSAGGRVQRDAGAGDTAADHQDVDRVAVAECGEFGGPAGGVQRASGHRFRYPFSAWASSVSSSRAAEDRLDHLRGLHGGLGDEQAHRRQPARVAGPHTAVFLGLFDLPGDRVDEDLLAGARGVRRCRPSRVRGRCAARPSRSRRAGACRRRRRCARPGPRVRRSRSAGSSSTRTTRLVSSAARIAFVSGQRRYTVGRLTPARRAISARVTRSMP